MTQAHVSPTHFRCRLFLTLIASLAVAIDLLFFTGYYASDDKEYYFGALRVASMGNLASVPLIGHTRLVVLAWNILVGWVTHFDVQLMGASYVVVHVALILLTYRLASRICSARAGLIAAYTSAVFPLYSLFSTGLYPDLFIACAFVLAVLAFLRWFECRMDGRNGRAALWLFASGVWIGVSYMAKETGLLALPFFLFAWLGSEIRLWKIGATSGPSAPKSPMKPTVESTDPRFVGPENSHPAIGGELRSVFRSLWIGSFFALGFLSIFLFEYKTLVSLTENPKFFRLGWTEKEEDLDSIGNFHRDGGYRPDRRFVESLNRLSMEYWPPLLKVCFAAGLLIYPLTPRRNWVVFFFGIWIYGFLTWGTYSFSHYYPPRIQARYYIPAFPFLIAIFSVSLAWLLDKAVFSMPPSQTRNRLVKLVVTGIALSPLVYMRGPNSLAGRLYRADIVANTQRAVRDAIDAGSPLVVVGDRLETRISPIWTDFPPLRTNGRRPKHVLSASEWRRIDTREALSSGNFSYVHTPPERSEVGKGLEYERVADLIHAAAAEQFLVRGIATDGAVPTSIQGIYEYYGPIEPGRPGTFSRDGLDYLVTSDRNYRHMFASRIRQLKAYFAGLKEIPKGDEASANPVQRLRVSVLRGDWASQSFRMLLGGKEGLPFDRMSVVNPDLGEIVWKESAGPKDTNRFATDENPESGLRIKLPADRRFTIYIAAKLGRREAGRMQLRFHADGQVNSKVIREVDLVLRGGVSTVSFQTFETPRFLSMSVDIPKGFDAENLQVGLVQFVRTESSVIPVGATSSTAD